ncbi:hypothetical protein KSX_55380 [Ktedonospora formicarum]|uniref:Uncharacterized protein n=1 Tax=Ktedonospora formicarum TaxID=2778364 RepID=A0A8J3MWA7_9CHLR|nr:hypothetical protein KSX_55380 [Ktedonospora formicarum]
MGSSLWQKKMGKEPLSRRRLLQVSSPAKPRPRILRHNYKIRSGSISIIGGNAILLMP